MGNTPRDHILLNKPYSLQQHSLVGLMKRRCKIRSSDRSRRGPRKRYRRPEIGEWRGALQPRALSEPDVNLSIHPAPIIQPWVPRPNGQTGSRRDAEAILTIPMPPACALGNRLYLRDTHRTMNASIVRSSYEAWRGRTGHSSAPTQQRMGRVHLAIPSRSRSLRKCSRHLRTSCRILLAALSLTAGMKLTKRF